MSAPQEVKMSEQVKRYRAHQIPESGRAGLWVHAGDFNQKMNQAKEREDALHAEAEALQRQVTELTNQRDAILLQARCWAGEAKAQQVITKAVGEALGGVPNWGPIAAGVEALRAENADLRAALAEQGERQEAQVIGRVHCNPDHPEPVRAVLNSIGRKLPDNAPLYADAQPGPDVRALVEALEWYEQKAAGCRKLTSEGDESRQALDSDGGKRAQTAIAAHRQAQRKGEQP